LLLQSLLFAFHQEATWWIQNNVKEYNETRRLVLPKMDWLSLSSWLEWQNYWKELKQRLLPFVLQYQATVSLMYFLQGFVSVFVSQETFYRLTQHPHHRALAVASRDSDRLSVGMEVWIVSLWANLLFFASSYCVSQIGLWYNYNQKTNPRANLGLSGNRHMVISMEAFVSSSWNLLYTRCRRYYYSSLGAGLASIFWPGWGTMLGIGLGDGWAELQKTDTDPFTNTTLSSLLFRISKSSSSPDPDDSTPSSPSILHDDELSCGCCQIVSFSSDPNSRDRAPISSRACDHTICKSCVQKCHLALMERTSNYEEWIKCPLCNAQHAFSSHNHLVNRSLCAAIVMIEQQQQQQQQPSKQP
jgi:hypothetical protein